MYLVSLLLMSSLLYGETTMKKQAAYGSWKSPITAQMAAQGSLVFSELTLVNGKLYWLEARAAESGRVALMSWTEKSGEQELLSKEFSVRTRVHEYGGGALLVTPDTIYFVRDQDQQVYARTHDGAIRQITHEAKTRFADGAYNAHDTSLYYVKEFHDKEVHNSIVKIDSRTGAITEVAGGNDFYSSPRLSPDGTQLAYITWNNPNMPWDGTELWILDINTGKKTFIAGSESESVCDPLWSPEGQLYYVSDRSNWWNLYTKEHVPVWATDAELALPQWNFGQSIIDFHGNNIICGYTKNALNYYAQIQLEPDKNTVTPLDLPFIALRTICVEGNTLGMIAGSAAHPTSVMVYDLKTKALKIIKRNNSLVIDAAYVPEPKILEFPTTDGLTAHAFYYPPTNPNFCGKPGEKPVMIVESHGGPTAHTKPIFHPEIFYWTSRGFAVLDVNYGGSTGYGRAYRDRLKSNWGIVDVDDCTNAALYCIEQGLADKNRLIIQGGSAGGFTTLAALAFKDVFKVGANHYGLSDLEVFVKDTHKFEARYLEQLVGKYPEEIQKYRDRSPVHSVHTIKSPVIIFQGDEDAIVPPSQSELIFNSLVARKIPTAYLLYKGEQHGFRKSENIQRTFEAQLYFFAQVLNFELPDPVEPVDIIR